MKEILKTIIESLVDDIESIEITETENDKTVELQVKISKDDMGKVIGKQGRTAKAIRTLMKSIAGRDNKKINIEFVD